MQSNLPSFTLLYHISPYPTLLIFILTQSNSPYLILSYHTSTYPTLFILFLTENHPTWAGTDKSDFEVLALFHVLVTVPTVDPVSGAGLGVVVIHFIHTQTLQGLTSESGGTGARTGSRLPIAITLVWIVLVVPVAPTFVFCIKKNKMFFLCFFFIWLPSKMAARWRILSVAKY